MLINLLFGETFHFAITVLCAFVFFAAGLLHFDSWQVNKLKRILLMRSVGFFLLAITFAIRAASLEIPLVALVAQVFEIIGLVLILISLIREPILQPPSKKKLALLTPFAVPVFSSSLIPLSAVLMLLISAAYFRKTTEGFDKHLKPVFLAFLFLGFSEILQISFFWSDTPIIYWAQLLSRFGIVFNLQSILQLTGIIILGIWVWGYIRFRIQVQLFVMIAALSLTLFLITTVFYTFLLLRNLEDDALFHLKTDVSVLQYSLNALQEKTLAHAKAVSQDSDIKQAFMQNDKEKLFSLTADFMSAQKTSTLLVASASGEVIMRAEDRGKTNDNVFEYPIVKSAIQGKGLATVVYRDGISYPQISVEAAVPLRDGSRSSGKIVGSIVTGFVIDSAFVDGVKTVTGLDVTVFGKDKRSATTFMAPDGKSRFVGTLETNKKVLDSVFKKGQIYTGAVTVLNQPFYTAYAPLETADDKIVGMLFVGKPQNTLTDAAERSISLTFLGSVILIVLSLIPAYFFSRFLKEHLEA